MDLYSIAQNVTTLLLPIILLLVLIMMIVGMIMFLKIIRIISKADEVVNDVKEISFMLTQWFSSSLFWVWDMIWSLFSWSAKKGKK